MKEIAVLIKKQEKPKQWENKTHEITVMKEEIKIEYEDGKEIKETIRKPFNLTRKINETAKILKQQTAKEKLEQITKALMN